MTPDEFAAVLSLTVAGVFLAGVVGIGIWLIRR
jgi:preprotein translocase subunit Sss1